MNAQISFVDGKFSLIHIPLSLYSSLLQPILQILLPQDGGGFGPLSSSASADPTAPLTDNLDGLAVDDKHGFLNISITPIECSIVCHHAWATKVFIPAIENLPTGTQKLVSISKDAYSIFSVSAAGMEAGSRVMELTAPLALAGIPIFFITTYWADFILVPSSSKKAVVQTLLARGFEFNDTDSAFTIPTPQLGHTRGNSSTSQPPSTPPPSNVAELQTRTFAQLKKRNVVPFVVPGLHLVQCSGKEMSDSDYTNGRPGSNGGNGYAVKRPHWLDGCDAKLFMAIISSLTMQPRFLSLTLSKEDAPSLLLDKTLLPTFGDSIAGDTDGFLIPIFLDLSNLPLESTGIVCGVAGRLVDDMREGLSGREGELSYLSTARAGAVILGSESSKRALEVLHPLLKEED